MTKKHQAELTAVAEKIYDLAANEIQTYINKTYGKNQENTLTAALRCVRKLGLATFLNDPQLACVTPADGEKLFDEMLENQRAYLPGKWFA